MVRSWHEHSPHNRAMEVRLDKQYPIDASIEQAWAVLADVRATAACMPGAQITEQLDDTHYKGIVKSKIGPAMMTFNGDIEVLGLDAGLRELKMLGKGADKSGSSATMNLTARIEPGDAANGCRLVGGKCYCRGCGIGQRESPGNFGSIGGRNHTGFWWPSVIGSSTSCCLLTGLCFECPDD